MQKKEKYYIEGIRCDSCKKDKSEIKEESHTYDIVRLVIVGVLIIFGHLSSYNHYSNYLFLATALWCGMPFFRAIYTSIKNRFIDADAFMGLGILGTLLIKEYLAGTVIGFLVLVARLIEEYTTEKSKSAIHSLIKAAPKTANVLVDGKEIETDVENVKPGDIVMVKAGEKIPVDGKIIKGTASVNQATITGESVDVEKNTGDTVFAGTILDSGFLQIKTEKVGIDSTYGKIIKLIEEAELSKAPVQKIADVFTNYFTPVVLLIVVVTFLLTRNFRIAVTVIVVACPCAVALATPLAFVAAIGKASRHGILIKGGIYLENLSKSKTVVFDKTGTLTEGVPQVVEIKKFDNHTENEIIECAAVAEKFSGHPLSKAILKKAEELKIAIPDPEDFKVIKGKGITATCSGRKIVLGSRELMQDENIKFPSEINGYMESHERDGKTPLITAHDGEVCGVITVSDVIRKNARESLFALRSAGIKKIIMLTGDNDRTARAIGELLGVDEVHSEMMPDEKTEQIKKLVNKNDKIVMVGDGINDAPALTQADVGIAMGAAGTDVAIESSDIALMGDDLSKIPEAILLGKRTFRTIKQNITLGMIFNIIGMGLAATGILSPMTAAIAHVLPDFIVFINSAKLFK
ncbi:MAG: cation-translocating P-type ATPase [Elusimicrobia bacterium]|nr:cation-translocating P-type ATPase [Elusimicrobiota bacterium]